MKEPKIRFKGFRGEWEIEKIGNFSTSFSGGTPTAGVPAYYGGNIPFIRSGEIHEDKTELSLTEKGYNNSSAKIVEIGTLLYALYGATSGDVAISKIQGAINQAILAITPYKLVETDFLADFLLCNKNKIVGELLQGGQGNLSGSLVKDINVAYPCISEQQSISSYFQHLDSLIQSTTKKIESLKQVKAASLQSMFPQEGETTPRVRFKGFEGEWEETPFSETFDYLKNNSLSRAELSDGGVVMNIHYGDVLIKYGECVDVGKEVKTFVKEEQVAKRLHQSCAITNGDIIFADAAEDNTVGKCSEIIAKEDDAIISGLHTIPCRPMKQFATRYLGYYLNSNAYHNQLLPHIQGTKISSISKKAMSQTHINSPLDIAEQRAIASYFTNLDRQITLHTQRLEKLKQIKTACLDEMFV